MATPAQKKLAQKRLADIREANNTRFKWTGFSGKTLWDWLNLFAILLIPIVVAGATIGLGLLQLQLADIQHRQDQQSASLQYGQDTTIALDQKQAAILQTYIDNMQDLLLNHNLLKSKPTDDVAILARARTLTALQGLDADAARKSLLVLFIYEARLIGFVDNTGKPHDAIFDLRYADLRGADLKGGDLRGVNLSGANLAGANLVGANLALTYLSGANLSYANLEDASMHYTNLNGPVLYGAIYNTKLAQVGVIQRTPVYVEPTQWPQGFNPKVAGATCVDC